MGRIPILGSEFYVKFVWKCNSVHFLFVHFKVWAKQAPKASFAIEVEYLSLHWGGSSDNENVILIHLFLSQPPCLAHGRIRCHITQLWLWSWTCMLLFCLLCSIFSPIYRKRGSRHSSVVALHSTCRQVVGPRSSNYVTHPLRGSTLYWVSGYISCTSSTNRTRTSSVS